MWLCTPCVAARSVTHDLVNSSRSFYSDWAGDELMPTVEQGETVAGLLWPDLIQEGDAVFLRSGREATGAPLGSFADLVEAECLVNHVHLLDEFDHGAGLELEPSWDARHDDFRRAISLAATVAEVWAARLALLFPLDEFAVFATRDDSPIVRFHKVRPNLPLWCDPREFEHGTVLLIRVKNGQIADRLGSLKGTEASS